MRGVKEQKREHSKKNHSIITFKKKKKTVTPQSFNYHVDIKMNFGGLTPLVVVEGSLVPNLCALQPKSCFL